MSNEYNPSAALGELFVDAAREVVERGRIKAQMERLLRIMDADRARLRNAYAEIGRMYCEGTLDKNKAKAEMVYDTIEHLKTRLERAKLRYDQLQEAHSVDECTVAFREELTSKVQQAKDASIAAAKDLGAKAKTAAGDLPDTIEDIKGRAAQAAGKAKAAVDEVAARASAAVSRMGKKATTDDDGDETSEDYTDVLFDLDNSDDYDEDDDSYIEEYSEADQAAAADITAILGSIDVTLRSVDEDDDTDTSASSSDATDEATTDEATTDEATTDEAASDSTATDGESADSFDF